MSLHLREGCPHDGPTLILQFSNAQMITPFFDLRRAPRPGQKAISYDLSEVLWIKADRQSCGRQVKILVGIIHVFLYHCISAFLLLSLAC